MEEDIKRIENAIKEVEDNKDIRFFETEEDLKFYNAVKHLVQAYKQQIDIIKNSVSKDKIMQLKDFVITECKQKNIYFIPTSNVIKNINILLEGDE